MDFVDFLGPDTSISVLLRLDDPADVVRAAAVSRAWRRFVITNGFCKNLCLRICPEVSEFSRVTEVNASQQHVTEVGSSSGMEWENLQKEHKIYSYLSHCLGSPVGKRNCIFDSIGASSTDNYPDESIENTLEPRERVDARPSYWSSGGQGDPEVPEMLIYRLCSTICIIDEIKIQPFKAFFQYGNPIYSARAVQFRLGYSRSTQLIENKNEEAGNSVENATRRADDNYVWTYVSPKFPMLQENTLQTFKLPRPVLGIGGVLQIDLLGRVQKQEMDDLYYICVCHVRVIGRPLAPVLDIDMKDGSGRPALQFLPAATQTALEEQQPQTPLEEQQPSVPSGGHSPPTARINPTPAVGGWILNALLGTGLVVEDSDSSEDEGENWYI